MGQTLRRLPSIGTLLLITGLLVLSPLVVVAQLQWNGASARVEGAQDAAESSSRLGNLLRLASALNKEQLSASWTAGSRGAFKDLPPGALQLIGMDFAVSLPDDRLAVDELAAAAHHPDLEASIANARRDADSAGNDIFGVGRKYDMAINDVISAVNKELLILTSAATAAGDPEFAQDAQIAAAVAGVQLVSADQDMIWALLAASPFVQPTVKDVSGFASGLTVYNERVDRLERLLAEGTIVAEEWNSYVSMSSTQEVLTQYRATANEFAMSGVTETASGQGGFDLADVDIAELLPLGARISTVLGLAEESKPALTSVVETALRNVDSSAEVAVANASSERNDTIAGIIISAGLVSMAAIGLVILVARPVQRMAEAADELGRGQLQTRLPERGPKEIRIGASALNAALGTLQIAESQAVALAEERLTDPVLAQPAPGGLGASLQAALSRLTTSLSDREDFQQRLAHEASHDGLTKLPNRNAIMKHLESALARTRRSSTPVALLFLDVDKFKSINDVHGHVGGDAVLRTIAQRLSKAIRQGDLAGRLGGDEFVVVAEPVANVGEAVALSTRILDAVSAPITYKGTTFSPSVSIGIGLSDDTLTADEMLRDADLAVYRAKSLGKGRVEVCDEDLRNELQVRSSLERSIRGALKNDEFVLRYQPIVAAPGIQITSVEALIRWERPGAGLVGPDAFIPVAERSDLILEIDRWVLNAAAAQLAVWQDVPNMNNISVAVNVSGRHLGSGTLCSDVQSALDGHGVNPQHLILEVTETALLEDLATAAYELAQLRQAGARIALDDFGTGYMSLAHLRGLPVDILKIDRSFIASLGSEVDLSLIKLIVDTGHILGATVTAEGIETTTQAELLTEIGSDHLQGYLFSRPVSAVDVESDIGSIPIS